MAKVTWSAGIDSVSGALSKPGSNPQHSCEKMLLATHRTAPTTSTDCNRVYLRKKMTRNLKANPYSQDEMLAHTRFSEVGSAVATRSKNLSTLAADRAAFKEQKDQPGGAKTFKAYLWKVCGEAYDQQHS